jgi:hypothetical protein
MPSNTRWVELTIAGHAGTPAVPVGFLQGTTFTPASIPPPRIDERTGDSIEPMGQWRRVAISVPEGVAKSAFQVQLRDMSTSTDDWGGLGVRRGMRLGFDPHGLAIVLAALALMHAWVAELACIAARKLDAQSSVFAALVLMGTVGMLAFFAYFFSRPLGIAFSSAVAVGLVIHAAIRRRSTRVGVEQTGAILLLAPATLLGTFLCIVGLFPFYGTWDLWTWTANRWNSLPIDDWLPKVLADQVWSSHVYTPMIGDWLSSDRPPLQAGIYLLVKPIAPALQAFYNPVSIWLQATSIIPLMILARRLFPWRSSVAAMTVLALCPVMLINGVFVWPKLLAATFAGMCFILLMDVKDHRASFQQAGLVGLTAALSMLSHGGTIFGLAGIFLAWLARPGLQRLRTVGMAASVALPAYLPWVLYQKLVDPPGTRLLSWHLAGVVPLSPTPFPTLLRQAYAGLTMGDWLQIRWSNILVMTRGTVAFFRDMGSWLAAGLPRPEQHVIQDLGFVHLAYSLWWFSPLPVAIAVITLIVRRRFPGKDLLDMSLAVGIGLLIWMIALFAPRSTILHQGAYISFLLVLMAAMKTVHAASIRAFSVLVSLQIFTVIVLMFYDPRGPSPVALPSYSVLAWLAFAALLAGFARYARSWVTNVDGRLRAYPWEDGTSCHDRIRA